MNEYDRHYEHSEIYENALHRRNVSDVQSLEEYFDNAQDAENLHMAVNKLPEVQKRRLKKYYFEEKTFYEIALEEGCTYQSIQRSVLAFLSVLLSAYALCVFAIQRQRQISIWKNI